MKTQTLEARIAAKARRRAEQDYSQFKKMVKESPFGKRLKIKIGDKSEELVADHSGGIIPNFIPKEYSNANIEEVLDELTDRYIEEESQSLLNQLQSIQQYLEAGQNIQELY